MWEIIGRSRELDGDEQERIAVLAQESGLHPHRIRTAIDLAAGLLREMGHDAAHGTGVGLGATGDREVAAAARDGDLVFVTGNVVDLAEEHDVVSFRGQAAPAHGVRAGCP